MFATQNQNKGKFVITNLSEAEKFRQLQEEQSKQNSSANRPVPCRYGRSCKRGNCKFYHSHLDKARLDATNSGNEFHSWIPLTIYMANDVENGSFDIKDNLSDWTDAVKSDYVEYSLVSVTSVVKSGEETFGNVVSAIKIDKAYFEGRKRQLIKKRIRQLQRLAPDNFDANLAQLISEADFELSDLSDDEADMTNDNELFTVDSRNCGMSEMEELPVYDANSDWYLFNHYSINSISIEEVLSNDLSWKIPTILMFMRKDMIDDGATSHQLRCAKNHISSSVFTNDPNSARPSASNMMSFLPLEMQVEMPKRGDLVAMDAEFVMLNHEETELRSDGTRTTIKPSHKSVARISCVRGSGPMQGVPFIDDYISTQDQVADYMTKFSG